MVNCVFVQLLPLGFRQSVNSAHVLGLAASLTFMTDVSDSTRSQLLLVKLQLVNLPTQLKVAFTLHPVLLRVDAIKFKHPSSIDPRRVFLTF